MANDCIPFKRPGEDLTAVATAAITGKKCVQVTGNRTSGPGLSTTAEGSVYSAGHPNAAGAAGAGKQIVGVAKYDAPSGALFGIVRGAIVPITAGGTGCLAGAEFEVLADGSVQTKNTGISLGIIMSAATAGNDAECLLYG